MRRVTRTIAAAGAAIVCCDGMLKSVRFAD